MKYSITVESDEESDYVQRNKLTIMHDGNVLDEHWDHGEPEDSSFYRDYYWVAGALEEAYRLGREDMRKELDERPDQ